MPKMEIKTVNDAIREAINLIQLKLPGADILYVDLTEDAVDRKSVV